MKLNKNRKFFKEIKTLEEFDTYLKSKDHNYKHHTKEIKQWFEENLDETFNDSYFHAKFYNEIYGRSQKSFFRKEFWTIRGYSETEAEEMSKSLADTNSKKGTSTIQKMSKEERKIFDSCSETFMKKKYKDDYEQKRKELIKKRTRNLPNREERHISQGFSQKEAKELVSKYQSDLAKTFWDSDNSSKRVTYTQVLYWTKRGLSEEEARKKISEIQKRFSKEICIEKYGEELGLKIFEERNRKWYNSLEATFIEKYGVRHYYFKDFNSDLELSKKVVEDKFLKGDKVSLKEMEEYYNVSRAYLIPILGDMGFDDKFFRRESLEFEIYDFIKENYNGEVRKNDRRTITPLELDIFIPELNFAIEFNGLMYHTSGISKYEKFNKIMDKNYHLNKTELCEERDIHLFHINEDEWLDPIKKEIWKSKILLKLGKADKIPARKTKVRRISHKEASKFLDLNHLQGSTAAKENFGLEIDGELVSVMTFGKSRFKDEYELHRFASLRNTIVIGGYSKLLNEYFKYNNVEEIISYGNRRWTFKENVYSKFSKMLSITKPNMFVLNPKTFKLENRMKYQKHKLKNLLENFNEHLTANENLMINGYRIFHDCGNYKYRIRKNYGKIHTSKNKFRERSDR